VTNTFYPIPRRNANLNNHEKYFTDLKGTLLSENSKLDRARYHVSSFI
jgi:hypothetical protein